MKKRLYKYRGTAEFITEYFSYNYLLYHYVRAENKKQAYELILKYYREWKIVGEPDFLTVERVNVTEPDRPSPNRKPK